MSTIIVIMIMIKMFVQAPKNMRKVSKTLIWILLTIPYAYGMFRILGEVGRSMTLTNYSTRLSWYPQWYVTCDLTLPQTSAHVTHGLN